MIDQHGRKIRRVKVLFHGYHVHFPMDEMSEHGYEFSDAAKDC